MYEREKRKTDVFSEEKQQAIITMNDESMPLQKRIIVVRFQLRKIIYLDSKLHSEAAKNNNYF